MVKSTQTDTADTFEGARVALGVWEKETQADRWTVKRITVAALFSLLWALLVEVRMLRLQQGRE
jgi:DNA-binding XRE family transcriptional regulator